MVLSYVARRPLSNRFRAPALSHCERSRIRARLTLNLRGCPCPGEGTLTGTLIGTLAGILAGIVRCRWDGDDASPTPADPDSKLDENWGILLCSNDNGDGTYEGYHDRHVDISQYFQNWRDGTIAIGVT
jgi:hypothetical protein